MTTRRTALKTLALGSAALGVSPAVWGAVRQNPQTTSALKDNIHASACYWCYGSIPLDQFCASLKQLGMSAIDLLGPKDFPVARKHGLYCAMCYGGDMGIPRGFNDPQYHAPMLKNYSELIPLVAKAGFKNVICFSGNRNGMDDETGLKHCVEGLRQVLPVAEKHGVTMVMELLNSKVDHHDYMCDHTAWGAELCHRLGSEHFKLLYDIYHMQIMEGDVIRTIREHHDCIAHYHTGGVPGRHEVDESQELFYPAVMRAILDTGYQGHVAQEFVPSSKDPREMIAALDKCVRICDV